MLVKVYVSNREMTKLFRKLVEATGVTWTDMEYGEVCRSDVFIILFSIFGESLDSIVESHPFNKIFVVGPCDIQRMGLRSFQNIEPMLNALKVLNSRSEEKNMPTVVTSSSQKKLRKKVGKVKCPFCEQEIGNVQLGLENHLVACREYQSRPVAFGHMFTQRQPNGRSKGSFLTVYIPKAIQVNDVYLKPGLHFICNGPLIKIVNACLKDRFRYVIETEDLT